MISIALYREPEFMSNFIVRIGDWKFLFGNLDLKSSSRTPDAPVTPDYMNY